VTLTDLAKSYVRVIVPVVVGTVVGFALKHGFDLHAYSGAVTAVVTVVYYAVVRLLERYVTPKFGWLLGLAQQPVYAKAKQRRDRPVHPAAGHVGVDVVIVIVVIFVILILFGIIR
jgi:hypothetical protein